MKKLGRLILFGFLSWIFTLAGAMCLSSLRTEQRRLFETLMSSVLIASAVLFTLLYFRKIHSGFMREAIWLGIAFMACNILFDLPMFMAGPMKMTLPDYLKDIGLTYLGMPIISLGFGYGFQRLSGHTAA